MAEDLSYLGRLAPDRIVINVAVAGNVGAHDGVLVKFEMFGGTKTETLLFFSGGAKALHKAFMLASADGRLPKISDQESNDMVASMPPIEDYDWNPQNEPNRSVKIVKAISFTNAICFEFIMQGDAVRQYTIPVKVARFLGEYMDQYKERFVHHQDDKPEKPKAE